MSQFPQFSKAAPPAQDQAARHVHLWETTNASRDLQACSQVLPSNSFSAEVRPLTPYTAFLTMAGHSPGPCGDRTMTTKADIQGHERETVIFMAHYWVPRQVGTFMGCTVMSQAVICPHSVFVSPLSLILLSGTFFFICYNLSMSFSVPWLKLRPHTIILCAHPFFFLSFFLAGGSTF